MDLNQYQELAKQTAVYDRSYGVFYPSLGLAGEAGEVADHAKKAIRDDGGKITVERRQAMKKELGDVLWYLAMVADDIDLSLDEIAKANVEKLASRAQRGRLAGSGDDR